MLTPLNINRPAQKGHDLSLGLTSGENEILHRDNEHSVLGTAHSLANSISEFNENAYLLGVMA